MGSYTQLSAEEVASIARRFGLGAVERWWPIAGGCVNSNFAIAAAAGRFFLRVNEGKGEEEVRYESELVEALAAAGVPTPAPLRACDGRPFTFHDEKLVSLFPWIEAGHRAIEQVSPADVTAVGGALAGMHLAGAPLADRFCRASRYRFEDIVRRFDGFRGSSDRELATAVRVLAEEIEWLEPRRPLREGATHGLIHGDLFVDNVFFRDRDLVALIDFEQASSGSFAYDLAVCIDAWCYQRDFVPELVGALVAGYSRARPLSRGDRAALYAEARAAAMRFTVTRITDAYLRPTGIPGKDFRRFLQRLARLREIGEERFRAWTGL